MYKLAVPSFFNDIITHQELLKSFDDSVYSNICKNEPQCCQIAHDIEEIDKNKYQLTLSVPGFTEDSLKITATEQFLSIEGEIKENTQKKILHKGIANRKFKQQFQFAEKIEVNEAKLENGLLYIALEFDKLKDSKVIAIKSDVTKKTLQNKS